MTELANPLQLPKDEVEIWFDFGSNYSYLSVMRIAELCEERGVALRWRPFLLGPIFKLIGWDTSPFVSQVRKGKYVWRDMERQCEKYGLEWKKPTEFPRRAVLSTRVAVLGADEPWASAFCRTIMQLNFVHDVDFDTPDAVGRVLADLGVDPQATLESAVSDANKLALRYNTQVATDLGIFGAPTFKVGEEIYWGNDRLEDALDAAASAGSSSPGPVQ